MAALGSYVVQTEARNHAVAWIVITRGLRTGHEQIGPEAGSAAVISSQKAPTRGAGVASSPLGLAYETLPTADA